jgi:hypothetical protein
MGETNPEILERLVYGNTANKKSGKLREALTGNLKEHHRVQLEWEKQEYDLFERFYLTFFEIYGGNIPFFPTLTVFFLLSIKGTLIYSDLRLCFLRNDL